MRMNEGGVDLKTYLGVERRQQPSNQARLLQTGCVPIWARRTGHGCRHALDGNELSEHLVSYKAKGHPGWMQSGAELGILHDLMTRVRRRRCESEKESTYCS